MTSPVRVEIKGKVLEVTLDRPKANSIDAATSRELGQVFTGFRDDPNLSCAILTGGGERFFSAGWDLKAAAEGEALDSDFGPGGFGGLSELFDLRKPVIAAVNGYAVGGGFELMMACDMAIAGETAQFWLPEAQLGIIADSAALRLPKRIPRAIASELLMTGRRMNADEAARWGLVNKVVPAGQVMAAAREMAEAVVASAPLSLAALKEAFAANETKSIEEGYALFKSGTLPIYEEMVNSEDAIEGPTAFAEKRPAKWKGR
ncbi:MAG: enoyl-CoA hydratase-related protein [Kiloniellales bacterium]|nr:enoyl-CoA hydratase-related protein [Kiloniellales bacterium]